MNDKDEPKEVLARLIEILAEAMTTDQEYIRIVATPISMRILGLRGRVESEHANGRKTYSVRVGSLVPRVMALMDELAAGGKE
ncbi:MAG: hypothetical protein KatS3mg082_1761 [Nitrospiraceae bacterium]|nr:MAG: hypothetical protein KatS3mg082_1761 [Nitrospiraceae bacterium]